MGIPWWSRNKIHGETDIIRLEIQRTLNKLSANHLKHHTLESYASLGMQDAQYSPNMTRDERLYIEELYTICRNHPKYATMKISEFI
jgi:hypothetical protein